ncbi:MAG: hypothetical protein AAFU86_00445 [Pseudomonadota bacterium]
MTDLLQSFKDRCEEYGRGRTSGSWGTARENQLLSSCTKAFEALVEQDVDISELFYADSEFVRYIAAVNAIQLNLHQDISERVVLEIRDAKSPGEMASLAYLVAIHFGFG